MSIQLDVKLKNKLYIRKFLDGVRMKLTELLKLEQQPLFKMIAYTDGLILNEVLDETFSGKYGYQLYWLKQQVNIQSELSIVELEDSIISDVNSAVNIVIYEIKRHPVVLPENVGLYISFDPYPREAIDMVVSACAGWAVAKQFNVKISDGGSNWINEEYMDPDQFIEKFSKTEVMKRCMIERKWEK